jgi:thiosulfate/3-mercaptopyruvate sulfurtransferase
MKSADELKQHFSSKGVTPDKNVAVHCQQGRAAAHSYFTLRLMGYPRIRSYDRSWAEWGAADDLPKTASASGAMNPCAVKNPCAAK